MAKTVAQLVAEAKASIENLTTEQVAQEIASGDVLLSVRGVRRLPRNSEARF